MSAVVRRESAHVDRPGLFGQWEGSRPEADHAGLDRVRVREVVLAEAPHDCHVRILVARSGLGVVSAPRDAEGNVALVVRIVVDGGLKRDDRLRDRGRVALRGIADDDDAIAAVATLFITALIARAAATAAAKPVDAIPGQFNRTGSRLATARAAAAEAAARSGILFAVIEAASSASSARVPGRNARDGAFSPLSAAAGIERRSGERGVAACRPCAAAAARKPIGQGGLLIAKSARMALLGHSRTDRFGLERGTATRSAGSARAMRVAVSARAATDGDDIHAAADDGRITTV